jgi:hypothetical protein
MSSKKVVMSRTETSVKNGVVTPAKEPRSTGIWLYIFGFFTGIFATLTVTILVGWIINTGVPHSNWLNKAYYGYALGCSIAD